MSRVLSRLYCLIHTLNYQKGQCSFKYTYQTFIISFRLTWFMERFSVSLNDEQNKWIEEKAEDLNGPKTQVIRMLVDRAREEPTLVDQPTETPEPDPRTMQRRISVIENRISQLESRLIQSTSSESQSHVQTELGSPNSEGEQMDLHSLSDVTGDSNSDALEIPERTPNSSKSNTSETSLTKWTKSKERSSNEVDSVLETTLELMKRDSIDTASAEEIISCWELLKKRETGTPHIFKRHCCSHQDSEEVQRDKWWEEGVYPVLVNLPGVERSKEDESHLRYQK